MLANCLFRLGETDAGTKQQQLAQTQLDNEWVDPHTRGISDLQVGLRAMLSKSDIAHETGKYDLAKQILEDLVVQYPDSDFAHIRLGRTLIRLARIAARRKDRDQAMRLYADAEQNLKRAMTLNPESVEGMFRTGVLFMYRSEIDGDASSLPTAESWFRKAIAAKADFDMAHFNLAQCFDRRGNTNDAITSMKEAVRIAPHNTEAHLALGGLLMKMGDLTGAESELKKTLEQKPGDPKATKWLNMIRQKRAIRLP